MDPANRLVVKVCTQQNFSQIFHLLTMKVNKLQAREGQLLTFCFYLLLRYCTSKEEKLCHYPICDSIILQATEQQNDYALQAGESSF
jgi:hypothetical protein